MSKYITRITNSLKNLILELSENPSLFLRNPEVDFSRKRKIDFKKFIGITLNSGGGTLSKELLGFFDFDVNTPSVSAYTQQRAKVLPDAFEYLFNSFTRENITSNNCFKGYRLIACDGSNLSIANNPSDPETLWVHNQYGDTSNHLHLNAFYDVLNRIYLDAVVQTASEYQEYRACINMMERSYINKAILVADRGYENYNLMAHAIHKGWKFVIRIKDRNSNGIASWLSLPKKDIFDENMSIIFTRQQTKATKMAGYKFMPSVQTFDFLPVKSKETYTINLRFVRVKLSDNSYELMVTNLKKSEFSAKDLKEIYKLRWGIETSFRELKYAIGLTSFHSRKVDYIKQEVFARLLLYNYCELITTHVILEMKPSKTKQVNFTMAIFVCREFLRNKGNLSPPDVIKLIEKHVLPIRPGRKDPRKVKTQSAVSFLYRVA